MKLKKFKTDHQVEFRRREANRKVRKQNIKLSTERKEVSHDTSYLESLFSKEKRATN